jgi:conjugal transfer pilus assembly protein TraB
MSSGLATSSNALMQFYLKMAEQMFPVVELDAGRKMTVIFMKGVEMTPESPKS